MKWFLEKKVMDYIPLRIHEIFKENIVLKTKLEHFEKK